MMSIEHFVLLLPRNLRFMFLKVKQRMSMNCSVSILIVTLCVYLFLPPAAFAKPLDSMEIEHPTRCINSLFVFASGYTTALTCMCQSDDGQANEISSAIAQIEKEYREALRKSKGDSSRQIQAKQQYQEKLRQLGKKHFAKLESIKSEEDLSNLAIAFQTGEQPVQAQTVIDRLLLLHPKSRQGHTLRVRHYANHATADEALKALTRSQNVLSAEAMKPLLPYWGVLGFKFASENRPKTSLDCLKRYLESRYEVAKTSVEPLPVLPVFLGKARGQYLVLGDQQGYRDCVKECQSRLDQIASEWKSDSKPKDARLLWQLHYHVASIFLAGELETKDPLEDYTKLINLSLENREWVSQRKSFPAILKHATEYAIGASHRWKDVENEIVWPEVSKQAKNEVEKNEFEVVSKQVQDAMEKVQTHRRSLLKIKKHSGDLTLNTRNLPENVSKNLDSGCVVCLAQKPRATFNKIRFQLSEISLCYPVVACVNSEDQRKSLTKFMRRLPKPIAKADLPFQIRVISLPEELRGLAVPEEVCWLMVKGGQVVECWLGSGDAKVAQMRWRLSNKTD